MRCVRRLGLLLLSWSGRCWQWQRQCGHRWRCWRWELWWELGRRCGGGLQRMWRLPVLQQQWRGWGREDVVLRWSWRAVVQIVVSRCRLRTWLLLRRWRCERHWWRRRRGVQVSAVLRVRVMRRVRQGRVQSGRRRRWRVMRVRGRRRCQRREVGRRRRRRRRRRWWRDQHGVAVRRLMGGALPVRSVQKGGLRVVGTGHGTGVQLLGRHPRHDGEAARGSRPRDGQWHKGWGPAARAPARRGTTVQPTLCVCVCAAVLCRCEVTNAAER